MSDASPQEEAAEYPWLATDCELGHVLGKKRVLMQEQSALTEKILLDLSRPFCRPLAAVGNVI